MLPEVPALVAGVDDHRVVRDAEVVQLVEDPADALVDGGDALEIVLDVPLVFRAGEIVTREFARFDRRLVRRVHVVVVGVPRQQLGLVEFRRRDQLQIP